MKLRLIIFVLIASAIAIWILPALAETDDLPVLIPKLQERRANVRNEVTFEQVHRIVGPDPDNKGLLIDLMDEDLHGTILTGPYPFEAGEADYDYARYRLTGPLLRGKGVLSIADMLKEKIKPKEWSSGQSLMTPVLGYRLDLWRTNWKIPQHLGFYDGVVAFRNEDKGFVKNLTILEGPFVALVCSDTPGSPVIAWQTDEPCKGTVSVYPAKTGENRDNTKAGELGNVKPKICIEPQDSTNHRVNVTGLDAFTEFNYCVECEKSDGERVKSRVYRFRTAPLPGKGSVSFAFVGDSVRGLGSGERSYMGLNLHSLSRIAADAYRQEANFFLFGGDLVEGYTSEPDDFGFQFRGWKQAMSGFWRTRPVYTGMGNHDSVLNIFGEGKSTILMDKWPYSLESSEAIFHNHFFNPNNGPEPSDTRRPTYKGNVYKFQYGPILIIVLNNTYWWTRDWAISKYGGSPHGYILEDQLEWVERSLINAETDGTVRYVILCAHEPAFPCGGHVKDSMWWGGNNNIRAFSRKDDFVLPEKLGIIEVRNRLWRAVSGCSKVAAMLTGHEHAYHRTLISNRTPVGLYPEDDTNNDGILARYSPNPQFLHPTWQITVGTAGAPYYTQEKAPWTPEIFSSQEGYVLVRADNKRISLKFISLTGQVVDCVDDLMEIKKQKR